MAEDPSKIYKILTHSDLTKRGGARIGVFLLKIKKGEEFVTTKGCVILNASQHDYLRDAMPRAGFSAPLIGKHKGREVEVQYPKDFFKTADLGGRGIGSGTAAEDAELRLFRGVIEETLERAAAPFINVMCGKKLIQVASIKTTEQTTSRAPKADFDLVDHMGQSTGFISHKAGRSAKDFQQYGGLSDPVFNVPDVKQFMKDVAKMHPNGLSSGQSFMRAVKDRNVVNRSIYGINYGQKHGIQNVSEFHLGNMRLDKAGNNYKINSVHRGDNGDIPTGDFQAVYFIRYGDRVARAAGEVVQKARVGVFARGKAVRTTVEI